jgi:glycosyltransferase involved in cell wall biosynthesis
VWVYDDCSTDDTAEVAQRLGARVVRGDLNRGCTFGKQVLAERTDCDWLHFHDADDILLPNFIDRSRYWTTRDDADVVIFGCEERWEGSGEVISRAIPDNSALSTDSIAATISQKINSSSGLYRRSSLLAAGGFDLDPEVFFNEDQALHCKLSRAGLRFRGDPTITAVYFRQLASMWTSNQAKALAAHYHVMRKALAAPNGAAHKKAIAYRLWLVAAGSAAQLDWKTADRAAALAMEIAGADVAPAGRTFKLLCGVSLRLALRVREWSIRAARPRLRAGYPAATLRTFGTFISRNGA